jgi:hypothetical protein
VPLTRPARADDVIEWSGRMISGPSSPSSVLFKFLGDQGEADVFDPQAVRILVAAFDGAWQFIKARGLNFRISKLNWCGKTLQST